MWVERRNGRRRVRTSRGIALRALIVLVVAALIAVTAASANGSDRAGGTTLKIGITDALSGPGAFYGVPQLGAWKVIASQINSKGGVAVGGQNYKIQLFADDDKWDPISTRSVIDKQVHQDHVAIVTTSGDPQDPIVIPVTEASKVILEDWSANIFLVKPPHKNVWNGWSAAYFVAKPYYQTLKKLHPNLKSVYHVGIDYQFDRNNTDWDKAAAQSLGLKWLGSTIYPTNTTNFSSVLAPVVQAKPDMIALGSEGTNTAAILKTLRQLGYKGLIASDLATEDLAADLAGAGASANNFYQVENFSRPYTPALAAFVKQYTKLGYKWNALAATQAIDNQFQINMLKTAGTISNPDKIMGTIERVSVKDWLLPGSPTIRIGGKKTFGQARELAFPVALNQVVNGKLKTQAIIKVTMP
jgi:branched-chain amino acid transport system substrate-binding protein